MPEDEQGDEEILDISAEDLEEPLPVVEPGDDEILVIEPEDLEDVPEWPQAAVSGPDYAPVEQAALPMAKKGLLTGGLIGSVVLQMAIAGAIGGFLAWLIQEPFITDRSTNEGMVAILAAMAGFGAILGGLIGLALGSVEGIVSSVWEKAYKGGLLGLAIGGVGGAFGGALGQLVYGLMGGGDPRRNLILQIGIRAFAWAVVGLFVGLGQGVMMRASRKIVNGLIGGAIGGLVGGFLFDPLSMVAVGLAQIAGAAIGGELSRMVGMTVMGACAGLAIGLVEEIRKEAWLTIIAGPLTGKQFIIYRSPTVIGSSPKADICLAKDTAVAPEHASVAIEGNRYILSHLGGPATMVNRRPITRQVLRDGDNIQVGATVLQYSTRTAPPLSEPHGQPY